MTWRDHIFCRDFSVDACLCCRGPRRRKRAMCCSPACTTTFAENHFWWAAAPAALRRAGYACEVCGRRPPRISAELGWLSGETGIHLEVHHKVPLNGAHRGTTCLNHQANLQVLCLDCHGLAHHPEGNRRKADALRRLNEREREAERLAALQPSLL